MNALSSFARIAVERTPNAVIAGVALALFAWAAIRLASRVTASTRIAVWLSLLLTIPGLSLAPLFLDRAANVSPVFPTITVPEGWVFTVFGVWAAIAALELLRVMFGVLRIRRIKRSCAQINVGSLDLSVRHTIQQSQPQRSVTLLESTSARVPMAVGFFRPAVIIPAWALRELSPAELNAIFLHEFAHLRRWDDWINFCQKILRALFFFHPAMWWLDRRLALDREMACDDLVLQTTNDPRAYAECLIGLAEKSFVRRGVALAQAAVHRLGQMSLRILEIMDASRPRSTNASKPALLALAAVLGASLIGVSYSPTLIAFTDRMPHLQASRPASNTFTTRNESRAQVIAATWHKPSIASPSFPMRNVHARASIGQSAAVRAKFMHDRKRQPMLTRAEMPVDRETSAPIESLLVVTRQGMLDVDGQMIWTVSVWRLTVFHPLQPAVQEGIIANSI